MIEKFTAEELEIIKRELGIAQTAGSKKSICSKQFKRINEMFPNDCEEVKHGLFAVKDVWGAITALCDYATRNFRKDYSDSRFKGSTKDWARYSSIFRKDEYLEVADELLDVFEKYRNKERED